MIVVAEEIAGLKFSDEERAAMANGLRHTTTARRARRRWTWRVR
jgi:hypothetical protein